MTTSSPDERNGRRQVDRQIGGAHVHGDVTDSSLMQVAGDQYNVLLQLGAGVRLPAGGLAGLLAGRGGRLWNVPVPVRSFTGRNDQLTAIHQQLTAQQTAALVPMTALYGMGGVGKTQLALAYANRYRAQYQLGWWIPADTELTITTALANLATELGLRRDLPSAELVARLSAVLAKEDGWLLIFDNATDAATLSPFLFGTGGGHVLITSRNPAWHGVADSVAVDVLPLEQAAWLLQQRGGDSDGRAATELAVALGALPLALEQAAAYASQYRLPLGRYRELLDQRRAELLARGTPLAYQGTVDATFTLATDRLRQTTPAAVQLLELCALLAPDQLPVELLLSHPDRLPQPLGTAAADPLAQGETVGALYQAGLLTHDAGETARVHRLVQAVTLDHLPYTDWQQRTIQVTGLLGTLFPDKVEQPDQWPRCAQLFTHALAALDHATTQQLTTTAVSQLLYLTARYVRARGLELQLARALDQQALTINRRLYQGDHPYIATGLHELAIDLRHLGEPERARDLVQQALAMRQRLYKGDHPDIANSLNKLASDLRRMGEPERARNLDKQALAMKQRLRDRSRRPHP